jgi:hypothetical protein
MTLPHSPLPWTVNEAGDIVDSRNLIVVAFYGFFDYGDRNDIVAAVNNYEKMMKALEVAEELLREDLQSLVDGHTVLYPPDPDYGKLDAEGREAVAPYEAALALIRAALAGEK